MKERNYNNNEETKKVEVDTPIKLKPVRPKPKAK